MDNVKNDRYYIQKIRNDLQFIVQHMKDVDIEELNANEILLDSMLFRMIQLSENAKKLSDEYKEKRGYIPWNAMYGLFFASLFCIKLQKVFVGCCTCIL